MLCFRDVFSKVAAVNSEDIAQWRLINKLSEIECGDELLQNAIKFNLGYEVYKTKSHREIFNVLYTQSNNLVSNKYLMSQGENSTTLVGAKGIGKSACMKIFSELITRIVPKLIVLHVSFNNIEKSMSALRASSLLDLLIIEIQKHVTLDFTNVSKEDQCESMLLQLTSKDYFVQILIDELEQLYRMKGDKGNFPIATTNIHDLSFLANQPSGRISIIVCGSSAVMENLITANANDAIRDEFPLLSTGAINLNGSKFHTCRVYSTLPTDLEAVRSITHSDCKDGEAHISWIRVVAYASGCSARNVRRVLRDKYDNTSGLNPENSVTGGNTLNHDEISIVREKIFKKLYTKNKTLMDFIFKGDVSVIIDRVAYHDWEARLVPLVYDDIADIWRKLVAKKLVANSTGNLVYYLLHLSDRNWFTLDGIRESKPQNIYPFSMAQMGKYILKQDLMEPYYAKVNDCLKNTGKAVARTETNPRVVVAVGYSCCCQYLYHTVNW